MTSLENWRSRGRLITLKDRDIFVIDEGQTDKPVIVFIHGFPTASWDFAPIWESLKNDYRLIAMDMLGFGFSAKPKKHKYSIMEQADIIEAMIKHLDLDEFHVFAHDYGDTVAQELLARQNSGTSTGRWTSLCLLNGGLFPETHNALTIQKLLLSPLGPLINKLSNKKRFDASVSRTFGPNSKPSKSDLDNFWTLINHNEGRMIFHKLITYMQDRIKNRERWVTALKDTPIKIALINGSFDPVSGDHMVERYINLLGPPAHLTRLENIGHYPHMEAPHLVVRSYLNFLSSI